MPVDFRDCFWGEGNNGFDVLYRNMKYGYVVTKDLAEFFKERSVIEETNSKLLLKLAKHASNCCSQGSFSPLWNILRTSTEKLAGLHMQMVQKFQELIKEIVKYSEDQHKKHKLCKEEESGTSDIVASIQQTTILLQKAKEAFNARTLEYEKLKRENASARELEKAEQKCRKACEDYKTYIEKYTAVREDFEKKMLISCQHFQNIEEAHIRQIKIFLSNYANVLENGHALIGQVHVDFMQQCNEMNVEKLLEHLVNERGTGFEKPRYVIFEEADLSPLEQCHSPDSSEVPGEEKPYKKEGSADSGGDTNSPSANNQNVSNNSSSKPSPPNSNALNRTNFRASKYWQSYWNSWSSGFLKSKREKRKEKKKKKLNGTKEDTSITSGDGDSQDVTTSPQIDDEGFTIRPLERNADHKENFYSSSDDSEEEEKERERKIHIEIKPVGNSTGMSASIDELIATVGTFSLSPDPQRQVNRPASSSAASTPDEGPLKRSISMSNPLNKADNSDFFSIFSPSASSASTPTGPTVGGFPSPDSFVSSKAPSTVDVAQNTDLKHSVIGESSSEVEPEIANCEIQRNLPSSRGSTPTGSMLSHVLPRPPSRRALEAATRGRMSPLPYSMTRTESVGSLTSDFKTTSMPVGSSRGPSPLTIGMSDTIPLAVAFSEVVNACFKGTDETRCQVRLVGDMKVSFPAGIIQVLANNPSPAHLVFRISKAGKLENILPNKQLITLDPSQSSKEQYVYDFNMPALTALLRKQFEQTPTASYFNIDILKYHIKALQGAKSTPLHLVSYWKCEPNSTDLRIDYKYNAASLAALAPLTNVNIIVPVNGGVVDVQSRPKVLWNSDTSRATWKIPELFHAAENGGLGSLRAHFELSSGPSTPCALAAQFVCNNASLSGADFELCGAGYRLSLVKKQVIAGKYLCESDPVTNSTA